MAQRGNGGIIGPANVPNAATASGVWTLEEQQEAKGLNSWPGFAIQRSLRFNSADFCNLYRTPASTTNTRTFTMSVWIKRALLAGSGGYTNDQKILNVGGGTNQTNFAISSDFLSLYDNQSTVNCNLQFSAKLRDVSAWYHIVLSVDTTQAVSTDRVKMYLNGTRLTATEPSASTFYAQNATTLINTTNQHFIGKQVNAGFPDWYMTEVNFIDGQALTPSSFGITNPDTGVWQPKAYTGTYGTNGFYLNFSDNSNTTATTLGKDYSGNGNNWTPENFSVSAGAGNDSLVDVPTAWGTDTGVGGTVRGNYSTLNAISKGSQITLTNGNLDYSHTGSTADCRVLSTIAMTSGKWYCEHTCTTTSTLFVVGIALASEAPNAGYVGYTSNSYGYYAQNGGKYNNDAFNPYGASYGTSGDVIGIAFDADAGSLTFYKNGVSQGVAFTGISAGSWVFAQGDYTGDPYTGTFNFGQRPFAYTAPSGFKALCTQNLPTPTIGATASTQAGKYFNAVIYTPTSYPAVTTGVGFQPDFTWWKNRVRGEGHGLFDVLRGSNLFLRSNTTAADDTQTNGWVANSDGWTSSSGSYTLNEAYVAWNWKANGAGVTNTAGSITSTVSANTTSGFSVVTYTGNNANATIGHGLGVAPSMVILKTRNTAGSWAVYHKATGATNGLNLNLTDGIATNIGFWNNTAPTSSVFSTGSYFATTNTYVAYCFAEVPGFSKFGSYTGNNSTDGPFVYCGFRPAWLLVKRTANVAGWFMVDSKRNTYNLVNNYLYANTSDAEQQYPIVDFLSNGFKVRMADTSMNAPGETYVFAAFAEFPQKFSLAR